MEEELGRLEAANDLRIRRGEQQWEFVIPSSFTTRPPGGGGGGEGEGDAAGAAAVVAGLGGGPLNAILSTINRFFRARGEAGEGGGAGKGGGRRTLADMLPEEFLRESDAAAGLAAEVAVAAPFLLPDGADGVGRDELGPEAGVGLAVPDLLSSGGGPASSSSGNGSSATGGVATGSELQQQQQEQQQQQQQQQQRRQAGAQEHQQRQRQTRRQRQQWAPLFPEGTPQRTAAQRFAKRPARPGSPAEATANGRSSDSSSGGASAAALGTSSSSSGIAQQQ
jgi:hypothetical protein